MYPFYKMPLCRLLLIGFFIQEGLSCSVSMTGNGVVTVGSTYTYQCTFSSCSNCNKQWTVDGAVVTKNTGVSSCSSHEDAQNNTVYNFVITLNYTWTRPNNTDYNQQNVSCQQTTDGVSTFTTVDIQYGPDDVIIPDNGEGGIYTVVEGADTPRISCSATCNPPCTMTFFDARSRSYSAPLYFQSIAKDKTGYYGCKASNSRGHRNSSTNIYINVQYKPIVTVSISPTSTADENATVTVKCRASGNPQVNIESVEQYLKTVKIRSLQNYSIESNETAYYLSRITYEDSGLYMCRVTNAIGSSTGSISLQVQTSPKLLMQTKSKTSMGDGSLEMSVDFISHVEKPVINWFKLPNMGIAADHPTLKPELLTSTNNLDIYNVSVPIQTYRCKLKIINRTATDDGVYIAIIRNRLGEEIISFDVTDNTNAGPLVENKNTLVIVGAIILGLGLIFMAIAVVLFIRYKRIKKSGNQSKATSNMLPSVDDLNLHTVGSSTAQLIQNGSKVDDNKEIQEQDSGYIQVTSHSPQEEYNPDDYQNTEFTSSGSSSAYSKNYVEVESDSHSHHKYANVKNPLETSSKYANVNVQGSKPLYENQKIKR